MSIRRLFPLFLLVVVALTLMTYQSNKGIIAPFRFVGDFLNHLNGIVHSFSTAVGEPFRKMMLRDEENKRLKAEMDRLVLEQQRYRDIFFENMRLREILGLREKDKRYIATARIISRGLDRWSNTVVIQKGKRDGVTKDMAVITPSGLVGKVSSAADNYAYVLLMTDINFSAAVRIQETRKEALLSGTGARRCVLKYVPEEDVIKGGEVVVTSGFDELFPQEVPVGYVSRVSKKGASIFQEIEITPFQDLTRLDEVVIVRR
ncbi:MAG: rod shape-determining protein MreC [Nitrospirae bacterium]|nr:rod shape-determining protein MreC [Nitrospirota bacterium]